MAPTADYPKGARLGLTYRAVAGRFVRGENDPWAMLDKCTLLRGRVPS